MFEWASGAEGWVSLATLTAMELVLGIDNIIFISVLAGRLPEAERDKARQLGLLAAAVSRLLLLLSVAWLARLTTPLMTVLGQELTGKSLVLLFGGLFLMYKATKEIHAKLEGAEEDAHPVGAAGAVTLRSILLQVMLLDVVFALDSVITAVGMTPYVSLMVLANLIALGGMLFFANPLARFVDRHPAIKMLALAFLMMIGMMLTAEGLGQHIPKGYIYSAMAFAVLVEILNIRSGSRPNPAAPVRLHETPRTPEMEE